MIYIEPGIYVFVTQPAGSQAPTPLPQENGFSEGTLYRVLGMSVMPESGECFVMLANDSNELRLIPNRHTRFGALDKNALLPRIPVRGSENVFPLDPPI